MRRQQPSGSQARFTPEFIKWLKQNHVSRRLVRKDPAALDLYYQEWMKAKRKERTRRPALLQMIPSLGSMDLGTMVGNLQIAREIFKAYQAIKGKSIFQSNRTA
ncbi:hypothetical protein ACFSO0_13605 [Brevibacillus sp. GCM10020057]|uniref:hypothetical protein n=1 Tax=Brevibacillus sp. GCM10020057 TaxID=3317327 RepID=UPI003632A2E7